MDILEPNTIYCGDCLDVMKQIENDSINLTITSPPYDNLRNYDGYMFDFKNIAKELFRVTKKGGVVVWIVNDATINGSETGTSFRQALYFKDICGFNLHDTMIYQKKGYRFPETNRYYPCFEYMFILSKGRPKTTNLITDQKNRFAGYKVARTTSERQKDGTLTENSAFRIAPNRVIKEIGVRHNIWTYGTGGGKSSTYIDAFQHPAIFPEQLAIDHIYTWSNESDVVLDPMIGSGTTAIACIRTKRHYIGIDISEVYVKIAKERIKIETQQLRWDFA